jgi:hypothetical protein
VNLVNALGMEFVYVPLDFQTISAKELDVWLQFYFVEVNTLDGGKYTAKTLYQLACALFRHIRELRWHKPAIDLLTCRHNLSQHVDIN